MTWTERFLALAEHLATWSKDPSTKVGAVLVNPDRCVIATGFNGFPRGVKDDERLDDREVKYRHVCHAEENAVAQAARLGVSLLGCTVYTSLFPCSRCARLLVQSGVGKVVCRLAVYPERWAEDFEISRGILQEGGVLVVEVECEPEPVEVQARGTGLPATRTALRAWMRETGRGLVSTWGSLYFRWHSNTGTYQHRIGPSGAYERWDGAFPDAGELEVVPDDGGDW